jgi:peptidoglycan/LPS O-acetylase OafA/YrhL
VLTWGLAAALLVSGMVFWSPSIQSLPGRVALVLGNASYSAYLASALVIEFVGRFLMHRGGQVSLAKEALFQIVIVAAIFVCGWISYEFVERRMIDWLRENL